MPLGVTAASYAIDGVSYVAQGKSTSDMAISGIAGENCALWRVVKGEDVCKEYTPEEKAQLASNKVEIARGHPEVVLMTEGQNLDAVATKIPPRTPTPAAPTTMVAEADPVPNSSPTEPPAVPVASVQAETLDAAPAPAGEKPAPVMVADATTTTTTTPIAEPVAAPVPASTSAHSRNVYLVVASYTEREGADRARARFAKAHPDIALTVIDGATNHRIVSGPFEPGELAHSRTRVEHALGVHNAWPLPACTGTGGPGCASLARLGVDSTQLAALPR